MSFMSLFTRKRQTTPHGGNTVFIQGDTFPAGAESYGTTSNVGDPAYITRVFPQWNFDPLAVYQTPMVFQELALVQDLPAGFPFGGMRSTALIHDADYPEIQGDYYS